MTIKSKTVPQGKLCSFWTKLRARKKGFYSTKSGFVNISLHSKNTTCLVDSLIQVCILTCNISVQFESLTYKITIKKI